MRVLHFFKTYRPDSFGGVERVIFNIAEGTHAFGVDTQVLSLSSKDVLLSTWEGRHIAHKSKLDFEIYSTGFSVSAIRNFYRLTKTVDIVHYHFPWPFADVAHFITRVNKPSILTYHSDIVKKSRLLKLYSPIMNRFLGDVDRIVATSPQYLLTSPVLQRYSEKTTVIPIGIEDRENGQYVGRVSDWRSRFPDGFFLFVGTLRHYKGLRFLAEAARLTGLPILVAGSGDAKRSIPSDKPSNLHFLGGVAEEDKLALLEACTAFVLPSHLRSEAFGVALLEAARAGKPMISCEIGTGTSFVNLDGVTGLTVAPADPGALANAMRKLWLDREMANEMGANARKRFLAHFTIDRMAAAYASLYRQLVGKGASKEMFDADASRDLDHTINRER
jgi:glycosyltransferase involved in cell wall biosynthesis